MIEPKVFEIDCSVQNYLWGKKGINSKVAELSHSANEKFIVDSSNHYAELWMGTHSKGPSRYRERDEPLQEFLSMYPHFIGASVTKIFGSESLPFLFKVLSVETALSIQVHPDKKTAEVLHSKDPEHYPDANHKPELAIALTEFHALCGFMPYEKIASLIYETPELREVIGVDNVDALKKSSTRDPDKVSIVLFESQTSIGKPINEVKPEPQALKHCFDILMTLEVTRVHFVLKSMFDRFTREASEKELDETKSLFLRLYKQYPGDIGCFMAYFMNYLILQPGEAIFLAAGLPHAYLSGDCMECMACSDNVVRAGLTPKFKDIDQLRAMLDYTPYTMGDLLFQPVVRNDVITSFTPDVIDFAVDKIQIKHDITSFNLEAHTSGSICIVISGECKISNYSIPKDKIILREGSTIFISANIDITIIPINDPTKKTRDVIMYRAYCPL